VNPTDQRVWTMAHLQHGEETFESNGSIFALKPARERLVCPEQALRVIRKHGITPDSLVLVETTSDGRELNHWPHNTQQEVPA